MAKRALKLREAADVRRGIAREIETLRDQLEAVPAGPDLPPGAVARVAARRRGGRARRRGRRRRGRRPRVRGRGWRASTAIRMVRTVAAMLAALEAAVFDAGELLLPRVQTAHADLAKRREERRAIHDRMEELAARLAGPGSDPAAIVLPRSLISDLRRAADAVRTARATAVGETRAGGRPRRISARRSRCRLASNGWRRRSLAWHRLPDKLEDALRVARDAAEALAESTVGLPANWRATADAGLPEVAEIEAVTEALQTAQSRLDRLAALKEEAERDWQASRSARDAASARPDVVLDAEIAESRARREEAWIAHRAALGAETADGFERAMREDDVGAEQACGDGGGTSEARPAGRGNARGGRRLLDDRVEALEAADSGGQGR